MLCGGEGCPVAARAFPGNTADPSALASQAQALRERCKLERVALVGDRGMIARARIDEDLRPAGLDWITALRNDTIKRLAREEVIQPRLFDKAGIGAGTCDDFPGERLLARFNPLAAAGRRRKRNLLPDRTEKDATAMAASFASGKFDRDDTAPQASHAKTLPTRPRCHQAKFAIYRA